MRRADPIVTRFHPMTGQLQMIAIRRQDTGQWAIPGGMVDEGEEVSVTVRRQCNVGCSAGWQHPNTYGVAS